MADSFKIKVSIAGRLYPVRVNNQNEEEGMRKAAKKINDLIAVFEKNYAVNDKQDVLAMCAFQFASVMEVNAINQEEEVKEATTKLKTLEALLDAQLKK